MAGGLARSHHFSLTAQHKQARPPGQAVLVEACLVLLPEFTNVARFIAAPKPKLSVFAPDLPGDGGPSSKLPTLTWLLTCTLFPVLLPSERKSKDYEKQVRP